MKVKAHKKIQTTHRVEIFRRELLDILGPALNLPMHVDIFVEIPGVADEAGETLALDAGVPLVLTWTTSEEVDL